MVSKNYAPYCIAYLLYLLYLNVCLTCSALTVGLDEDTMQQDRSSSIYKTLHCALIYREIVNGHRGDGGVEVIKPLVYFFLIESPEDFAEMELQL